VADAPSHPRTDTTTGLRHRTTAKSSSQCTKIAIDVCAKPYDEVESDTMWKVLVDDAVLRPSRLIGGTAAP
jgi:hypothetical protein